MALVRIQLRRDTAEDWSTNNPVLAEGEMGVELDTGRIKVGDGVRNWLNLPYTSGAPPADTSPLDVGQRSTGSSLLYARADHSHAFPSSVTFVSLVAGSATIAGDLSVTGRLIGGTHTHVSANITDWATAVSAAVFANLAAGSGISLSRNTGTGVTTITATGSGGGSAVSSVAGRTGDVLLSTSDLGNFPAPTGQTGKYLKTDGSTLIWDDPLEDGGVSTVNELTGEVVIRAGTNVTMFTNPSTNEITINATTSAGTGDVTSVNALIGDVSIAAAAGSGLSVTASGATIEIDAAIDYGSLTNVPSTFPPAAHAHDPADITGLQEFIDDAVGTLLVAGTNVTLTYDDAAGTLTVDAAGASADTLVAGNAIAIDTDTPGEAEISVDGTLDGGGYEGFALASDPPYFSIQPQSQLVTIGTAIFTARVENAESPTYLWQKAEAGTDTWLGLTNTSPYEGVTTPTLSVSPVSDTDNGDRFRLVVTLPDLSSLVSDVAVLTTVPLILTDQPLSAEFVEADTINVESSLLVIVDGGTPPYTYQWQKWNGSSWANVSGETNYYVDTISGVLGASESERVERWRVVVTDTNGVKAFSDEARITIRAGAPQIVLDPTDQTISGGSATFTARHNGKGASTSWERREPGGDDFVAIGATGNLTSTGGITETSLTVSGMTGNDNGAEYRVRVTNAAGFAVSRAAVLATGGPFISVQPNDVTVVENSQAVFSVTANYSLGPITYQWQESTNGGTTWGSLSGKTSATLTLTPSEVPLGRDGSDFRVIATGGGVDTYSKPARLTVISAPAAGDNIFTSPPADGTYSAGGSYSLSATSTWLSGTNHYAAVRVEYDDGTVEYHPLSTGTTWNGTVLRRFLSGAHSQYRATLQLARSAWVSVVASTSEPTAKTGSGSTYTLQPWAEPLYRNCVPETNPNRPRPGIITYPVSLFVLPQCSGSITLNVPDPPYTYVESARARVTVVPRKSYVAPVASSGFWNPPLSYQFVGSASINSDSVVAAGNDGLSISYLVSFDGGDTWQTRFFPRPVQAIRVIYAYGNYYVFYFDNATFGTFVSTDEGISFQDTGDNFGGAVQDASFAGGVLFAQMANGSTWVRQENTAWRLLSVSLGAVGYAHGRFYSGNGSTLDPYSWPQVGGGGSYAPFWIDWPYVGDPLRQRRATDLLRPIRYYPVTLPDPTQSYTITNNGLVAPVVGGVGGTAFGAITSGETGAGPQAGSFLYCGDVRPWPGYEIYRGRWYSTLGVYETPTYGGYFFRKGVANPTVNETLIRHISFRANEDRRTSWMGRGDNRGFVDVGPWSGNQLGAWADVQIMSYQFGEPFGPNLDTTLWGTLNDPSVPGAIFTKKKIIHLFRYRANDPGRPPTTGGGNIPVPPRRGGWTAPGPTN